MPLLPLSKTSRLNSISPDSYFRFLNWAILAAAFLFQAVQYFSYRDFWLDEVRLVINILDRSFLELTYPLDYGQSAPVGFLWGVKLFTVLFGDSEYVLRFFPFLCSTASIFLFYQLAKQVLSRGALPIALLLFALCGDLIYYAAEVKQYSLDVLVTILLCLCAVPWLRTERSVKQVVILGIMGVMALFCSQPAIFILGSISVCVLMESWQQKKRGEIWALLVAGIVWASVFSLIYLWIFQSLDSRTKLFDFWAKDFMPFPPKSWQDFKWIGASFLKSFKDPFSFYLYDLAALVFVAGCLRTWTAKRFLFWLTILSLLLTLIASGFHKYPFAKRLILFLAPLYFLQMAEGVHYIRTRFIQAGAPFVGWLLIGILLFYPATTAAHNLFHPVQHEEINPVIKRIRKEWKPGDKVFVHYYARSSFPYYARRHGFQKSDYILGVRTKGKSGSYALQLNELCRYSRVWVVFSHVKAKSGAYEEALYLNYLKTLGSKEKDFSGFGTSAYLFNLKDKEKCPTA